MKTLSFTSFLLALFLITSCNSTPRNEEPSGPKTVTITIEQMKFTPADVTINKGDTLLFINKDMFAHDVTEKDKAWQSPRLEATDNWKFVPEESADYYCSLHLIMTGHFTVK
ncbi:MAG: plastocyanin/azurin family copper-binding protein [Chitinophagales bacterium]|nr:plastocyanin/azurin family copper-binding protein [Chitinophagales bacterium]